MASRVIITPAGAGAFSLTFLSAALGLGSRAAGLSIKPGSQLGFPLRRGFSFSPAAIFRGLGSAAGASVEPTCCRTEPRQGPPGGRRLLGEARQARSQCCWDDPWACSGGEALPVFGQGGKFQGGVPRSP